MAKAPQHLLTGSSLGPAREALCPQSPRVSPGNICGAAFRGHPVQSLALGGQPAGLGWAEMEGLGLGAGEAAVGGTRALRNLEFPRDHRVLIRRPASPAEPAALPAPQPRARRVSGLRAGNCRRQEVKTATLVSLGRKKEKAEI